MKKKRSFHTMSKEREKILKIFKERFLKPNFSPHSFSDILNYPPICFKNCSEEENALLKKHKIKQVRNLVKYNQTKIQNLSKNTGIEINKVRQWVLAAQMISRAWQKRSLYLKKKEMKVCVLGLDNAGKTSMLRSLAGKVNFSEIGDLEPTIGVDIMRLQSPNYNLVIWDFGGQIGHRHDYFQSPEEYFLQVDLIIYVIDLQDPDRYYETLEYLDQIVDTLEFLGEHPYYLVLLHKADPDKKNDPDFQLNKDFIHDMVKSKLQEYELSYEIVESSIYNYYSMEPEFASTFKSIFASRKKTKSTGELIAALTNTVLKASARMIEEMSRLRTMMEQLIQTSPSSSSMEQSKSSSLQSKTTKGDPSLSALTPPKGLSPPPPPSRTTSTPKIGGGNTRADLLSELKKVFELRHLTSQE